MIHYLKGDCRDVLPTLDAESVHCCVTSPPYWNLRDYGMAGQIGLEKTPEEFVQGLAAVFREVRRVLTPDGTLWINMGDSYNSGSPGSRDATRWPKQSRNDHRTNRKKLPSIKTKDLIGIPWMLAFALRADGWYLRSEIIWSKPNCMPESVADRPTKSHEHIFLLTKSDRYHYDADAIREPHAEDSLARVKRGRSADHKYTDGGPGNQTIAKDLADACHPGGRNRRTVWTVANAPYSGSHFAVFPPELIRPCIRAGCPPGGTVLDPFAGTGTTALVAEQEGRHATLIDLNPEYIDLQKKRTAQTSLLAPQ